VTGKNGHHEMDGHDEVEDGEEIDGECEIEEDHNEIAFGDVTF
jgi:hypothetical protein